MSSHNPVIVYSSAYTLIHDSTTSVFSGVIQLIGGSSCVCRIASSLPSVDEGGFVVAPQSTVNVSIGGGEKLYAKSQNEGSILILIDGGFVNLVNGGIAVSTSNPLPVNSQLDNKTSNTQAVLDGLMSKCWITCPPTATKYPAVQIWNPTSNDINLLIVGMNGYNSSTTMKWFQFLDATKLSTLGGFQQNMKVGAANFPYEMYCEALDAKTATNSVGINVTATTPQGQGLQMAGENVCIPANSGIRFEGETAGIGMTLICTLIPSSSV